MKTGQTCTVVVDVIDALSVGLSLRAVARGQAMPAETRAIYDRVGGQLVAAARAETTNCDAEATSGSKVGAQ